MFAKYKRIKLETLRLRFRNVPDNATEANATFFLKKRHTFINSITFKLSDFDGNVVSTEMSYVQDTNENYIVCMLIAIQICNCFAVMHSL